MDKDDVWTDNPDAELRAVDVMELFSGWLQDVETWGPLRLTEAGLFAVPISPGALQSMTPEEIRDADIHPTGNLSEPILTLGVSTRRDAWRFMNAVGIASFSEQDLAPRASSADQLIGDHATEGPRQAIAASRVVKHRTRGKPVDAVDPVIVAAQDAAVQVGGEAMRWKPVPVWQQLIDLALNETPPFTGKVEAMRLEYTDGNRKLQWFTSNALDGRLRRNRPS